jgi:uncharacterized coiled-coil DUF342 family protein
MSDIKKSLDAIKERQAATKDKRAEFKQKREEVRKQIRTLSDERGALLGRQDEFKKRRDMHRDAISCAGKNLSINSVQDIEEKIRDIDFRMNTQSMPLVEEKKLIAQIKELKGMKEKVQQVQEHKDAMAKDATEQQVLKETIRNKTQALNQLREQERAINEDADKLFGAKTQSPSWDELQKRHKELWKETVELRAAIRERRAQFKEETRKFEKFLDEQKRWARQQRRENMKAQKAEEEARMEEIEAEAKAAAAETHPWQQELFFCNDLAQYLQQMLPKAADTKEATVSKSYSEGQAIGKTAASDDGALFAATRVGKKGKKKHKAVDPRLTHSADAISEASHIGVVLPACASGVQAALDEVWRLKEAFQTKTKEEKEAFDAQRQKEAKESQKAAKAQRSAVAAGAAQSAPSGPAPVDTVPTVGLAFRNAVVGN